MSLCINPNCPNPQNPGNSMFCQSCGSELLLEGRYRVTKLLGQGSFGKTYEVSDRTLTPKVLKVLTITDPNCLRNPQCVAQAINLFQREADVLQRLNHSGIPKVERDGYFTFLPRNRPEALHCLVMEKVEGIDLDKYLKQRGNQPIKEKMAVEWLMELVNILQEVHQKNFFHRDIKPTNIMLKADGNLALIDFGAVKQAAATPGTIVYTPGYAPQEQQNGQAEPRSDFFALGRTFVYLLTGKDPNTFPEHNGELIWRGNTNQVSKELADFIDHLMAPSPQHRPQNTQEILQRLEGIYQILRGGTKQPDPPPPPQPSRYAGFWIRFLATFIDGIIINVAVFIIAFMLGIFYGMSGGTSEGAAVHGFYVGILLGWLYYAIMESSPKQATFGKQAMGIVVTDINGNRITFVNATGRYFAKYLSLMTLFIGYIMAAFTERKQALHDKMAETLVVKRSKSSVGVIVASVSIVGFVLLFLIFLLVAIESSFMEQAVKGKQAEAKVYINAINRAEQAYYTENSQFTANFTELGVGIKTETQNYSYKIKSASTHYVISTATAKESDLKSYTGTVYVAQGEDNSSVSKTIICESDEPSTTPPSLRVNSNNQLVCSTGASEL